ncbi:MAG: ribosome biogenesis GTP-binding protein YsxC [Bacteroidetes bacterium]|nr:ribosome biogenesis GTP-binding protein YsxC [Bacteroidota bacterium]
MTVDPSSLSLASWPHVAFIGRSNVGKSSLINLLTTRQTIARTSASPGKTQTLNFYSSGEDFYIVDMPGYGFAKVSRSSREKWRTMTLSYLNQFADRLHLFLLVDGRHPLQPTDEEFWNQVTGVPAAKSVILTKTDASRQSDIAKCKQSVRDWMKDKHVEWPVFQTSSEKGTGRKELITHIITIVQNTRERI